MIDLAALVLLSGMFSSSLLKHTTPHFSTNLGTGDGWVGAPAATVAVAVLVAELVTIAVAVHRHLLAQGHA